MIKNIICLGKNVDAWNSIENMLNEVIISGNGVVADCKLRDAIKIIANKSICHYDNFYKKGNYSWDLIQLLKQILVDKNEKINLDAIMKCIKGILHNGVEIEFEN